MNSNDRAEIRIDLTSTPDKIDFIPPGEPGPFARWISFFR